MSHKSCILRTALFATIVLPPQNNLDCEGATMRGWAFYDLECRNCGGKGLLGVWAETHMGDEVWNAEWKGFFGVVDQKTGPDPEAVQCAGRRSECDSAGRISGSQPRYGTGVGLVRP
jgi:hypothetical protein